MVIAPPTSKLWSDDLDERRGYPHLGKLMKAPYDSARIHVSRMAGGRRGRRWSATTLPSAAVRKPCFGHRFCNFWAARWRYLNIVIRVPSCCGFVCKLWTPMPRWRTIFFYICFQIIILPSCKLTVCHGKSPYVSCVNQRTKYGLHGSVIHRHSCSRPWSPTMRAWVLVTWLKPLELHVAFHLITRA